MLRLLSRKPFVIIALLVVFGFAELPAAPAQTASGSPEEAVELFNKGQDAHESGDLRTAAELYRKALAIVPEFPEAEYQLGAALLALKQPAEAEQAYRRAVALRVDWTLPMVALGALLVERGAFDEAETLLVRVLELDAANAPAYVALTDLRIRTGAPPETLKQLLARLQTVTAKANPTAAAWAARAALERRLDARDAAKASVGRALALDPQNRTALAERVELAFADNDPAAALETAQTLVRIAPDSAVSKFLLARALAETGRTADALRTLDEIAEPSADVRQLRAKIAADSSGNAAELEKELAKDPRNAAVLGRLCGLLRTENPARALDFCRRASEAEPSNLNYVIGYGAALVQAKQFDSAVGLFRRIVAVAPDNYTARANLAIALFQLKRYAEAKTEYRWLADKQPEIAVTYFFLGIIHDRLTEYLDAMANYQQFLRLADADKNRLEIEQVNLRLPVLQRQIKEKKGKK